MNRKKLKKSVLLVTMVLLSAAALFAQGWGDEGDGWGDEGGWGQGGYYGNPANPAARQQFLAAYPGVKTFVDQKTAAGATVLEVGLESSWGAGVVGEVVAVEAGKVTVYYVNTTSGEVVSQFQPPASAW